MQPTHKILEEALGTAQEKSSGRTLWQELFQSLEKPRARMSIASWRSYVEDLRRNPLFELCQNEPITRRCFRKPRGYAGDAVTMDMLYGMAEEPQQLQCADVPTLVLQSQMLSSSAVKGVRKRRQYAAEFLGQLDRGEEQAAVLSVACGHLREGASIGQGEGSNVTRLVGLDQDPRSLAEVRRSLGTAPLETVEAPVRSLLKREQDLGQFDLIYSLGLYDYLESRTAARLTERMFKMLKPGGRLIVANFLPISMRAYMEAFMGWWLIYRSLDQVADFASEIDPDSIGSMEVRACDEDVIGWLDLRKAA